MEQRELRAEQLGPRQGLEGPGELSPEGFSCTHPFCVELGVN